MNLQLPTALGERYSSSTQKIRVITESWASHNAFCPACLGFLEPAPNNSPATDFICRRCQHGFELKSKNGKLGQKVVDGAYSAMAGRIIEGTQPNLFLLSYDQNLHVQQFLLVPRQFLVLPIVEKRKPLAATARRAGWVGCNLLIGDLPPDGRISYIDQSIARSQRDIQMEWRQSLFVDTIEAGSRGWLVAVMACIRKLQKQRFELADLYTFEGILHHQFPNNRNIRPKIRQQLQVLRDKGWLTFEGRGIYQLTPFS